MTSASQMDFPFRRQEYGYVFLLIGWKCLRKRLLCSDSCFSYVFNIVFASFIHFFLFLNLHSFIFSFFLAKKTCAEIDILLLYGLLLYISSIVLSQSSLSLWSHRARHHMLTPCPHMVTFFDFFWGKNSSGFNFNLLNFFLHELVNWSF